LGQTQQQAADPGAGKRDLPAQLRQRFTELYVPEMTNRGDLQQLVLSYLRNSTQDPPVDAIIDFYLASRSEAVRLLPFSVSQRLRVLESSGLRQQGSSGSWGVMIILTLGLSRGHPIKVPPVNNEKNSFLNAWLLTSAAARPFCRVDGIDCIPVRHCKNMAKWLPNDCILAQTCLAGHVWSSDFD